MQNASKEYKEQIKKPMRNRFYMIATVGVINETAQKHADAENALNSYAYFSTEQSIFEGKKEHGIYATCENGINVLDGNRYFLPKNTNEANRYCGAVTNSFLGSIQVDLNVTVDIKGLTIDFGSVYPTEFTVEYNGGTKSYTNSNSLFITEDVFSNVTYFKITPTAMSNKTSSCRMRIYCINFGVSYSFDNDSIINYSMNEYTSPICETLPSIDMTLTVDNSDLTYSVDNSDNPIFFMEVGQEVRAKFGYELDDGTIEWIKENFSYLSNWSSDDKQCTFTATDVFINLTSMFYGGKYRSSGITLYNLAVEVFTDMGYTSNEYIIDDYLKNVTTYNPIPPMRHVEALQLIANAGRCMLLQSRDGKIEIRSNFVPDITVSSSSQAAISNVTNIANDNKNDFYAMSFKGFSKLDNSLLFEPDSNYNTGYVSNCVSDVNGNFSTNPSITLEFNSTLVSYGLFITFFNTYATEFQVRTYKNNVLQETANYTNDSVKFYDSKNFNSFNKMVIEFSKTKPNQRIVVDKVGVGNYTDYELNYDDFSKTPNGSRTDKIKCIMVQKTNYIESVDNAKEIVKEKYVVNSTNNVVDMYFTNASYGVTFSTTTQNITITTTQISDYHAKLTLSGSGLTSSDIEIEITAEGYEYRTVYGYYSKMHNNDGIYKEWNNVLISTDELAKDVEEWISQHFCGSVDYNISYRGDPRIDANDLFYIELKNRKTQLVRCYNNRISMNQGYVSASMNARRYDVNAD